MSRRTGLVALTLACCVAGVMSRLGPRTVDARLVEVLPDPKKRSIALSIGEGDSRLGYLLLPIHAPFQMSGIGAWHLPHELLKGTKHGRNAPAIVRLGLCSRAMEAQPALRPGAAVQNLSAALLWVVRSPDGPRATHEELRGLRDGELGWTSFTGNHQPGVEQKIRSSWGPATLVTSHALRNATDKSFHGYESLSCLTLPSPGLVLVVRTYLQTRPGDPQTGVELFLRSIEWAKPSKQLKLSKRMQRIEYFSRTSWVNEPQIPQTRICVSFELPGDFVRLPRTEHDSSLARYERRYKGGRTVLELHHSTRARIVRLDPVVSTWLARRAAVLLEENAPANIDAVDETDAPGAPFVRLEGKSSDPTHRAFRVRFRIGTGEGRRSVEEHIVALGAPSQTMVWVLRDEPTGPPLKKQARAAARVIGRIEQSLVFIRDGKN